MKYLWYNLGVLIVNILLLLLLFILGFSGALSGSTTYVYKVVYDYYQGVIVDTNRIPLKDVQVSLEIDSLCSTVLTDSNGYFMMNDPLSKALKAKPRYKELQLSIQDKNFSVSTEIEEENPRYGSYRFIPYFVRKKMDTIVVDLKNIKYEIR